MYRLPGPITCWEQHTEGAQTEQRKIKEHDMASDNGTLCTHKAEHECTRG